jgi:hypothetical protein
MVSGQFKNTPDAGKYKIVGKFEQKVLIWCVISEVCVSTPFIRTIQAVDADVYITKCLFKMVKFIKKHHKNDETIYGPI